MLMALKIKHIFSYVLTLSLAVGVLTGCTPSGPKALLQGEALLKQNRLSEAIKKIEKATKRMPNNERAWLFLGMAYHQSGDHQKALLAYERANTLNPGMSILPYNLGCLYLDMKNYNLAINSFSSYLRFNNQSADAWEKIGYAYLAIQQTNTAVDCLNNFLKFSPGNAKAHNSLGLILMAENRIPEALQQFQYSARYDTSYAPPYLNMGVIFQQKGGETNIQTAIRAYNEYLKRVPASSTAEAVRNQIIALSSLVQPKQVAKEEVKAPQQEQTSVENKVEEKTPEVKVVEQPTLPVTEPPQTEKTIEIAAQTQSQVSTNQEVLAQATNPVETVATQTNVNVVITKLDAETPAPVNTTPKQEEPKVETASIQQAAPSAENVQKQEPSTPKEVTPPARNENVNINTSPAVETVQPQAPVKQDEEPLEEVDVTVKNTQAPVEKTVDKIGDLQVNLAEQREPVISPIPDLDEEEIETPSEPQVKEIKTTESKPENKKIISIIPKETNNKGENSDKKGNIFTRMFSKKENSTTTEPDSNTEKNKQTNKPKEKVSNAGVQPVPPTISVIPDENEEDTELTETPKEPIHVYNTYKYKNPPKPASGDRQAGQADFQRAYRAHQNKDMATAAEYYLKAIQKDPNWYDAHFNLGLAYYSAGEYSSALLAFENALAVNPDSWEARYNFALALNKANYPNEAILELLKSARLNDKYANTWLELGMIYDTRFSDIENAYQCYQKFIEVAPEHPSAYAAKVWMARHADQVKQK